ncbi:MAG: hypothetical protein ACM3PC_01655 [Deltaproteobacteria bacterium]
MNFLPMHNALVHLPLGLSIGAAILALALAAAIWRNWLPGRSLALLAVLQGVVLIGGALAFRSGKDAGEQAEDEAVVEEHEERAEAFLWTNGVALAVTAAAYAARRRDFSRWGAAAAAVAAVAAAGAGVWVGKAGGAIAHGQEIAARAQGGHGDDD